MLKFKTDYPPEVEEYRQFLLGELRRMEAEAQEKLTRTIVDHRAIHRELLQQQQPLLDELTRIYQTHAQPTIIVPYSFNEFML